MKNIPRIIFLFILISNFSFAQHNEIKNNKIKYFDKNYSPISKRKFEKRKWEKNLLGVQGDSINHKILVVREIQGKIENKRLLDSLLSSETKINIDSSKPTVIIYYPGQDSCNSSGLATRKSLRNWYNDMERGINKVCESNVLYIYKDSSGLYGRNDGFKDWYKDPENIIGELFFKKHYPCSSFVVISKNGECISYFGEFGKDHVWVATELMCD